MRWQFLKVASEPGRKPDTIRAPSSLWPILESALEYNNACLVSSVASQLVACRYERILKLVDADHWLPSTRFIHHPMTFLILRHCQETNPPRDKRNSHSDSPHCNCERYREVRCSIPTLGICLFLNLKENRQVDNSPSKVRELILAYSALRHEFERVLTCASYRQATVRRRDACSEWGARCNSCIGYRSGRLYSNI